ncbi:Aldo/keto reductase [Moelleriella libera RCEF 2490]|uniref:Aldo/keto reductase n=1 Tax=Moelleriella libera RCEF 2490 TaxID=1081109 RepID=A0A167WQV9_9HYPO|nr:Aldo/keto reductase [Moelleriella libera RCEF 2490]
MPTVVGKQVGPIGYGLMGLGHSPSDEVSFAAIKAAIEAGCTFLNGAEFYGPNRDENSLTLLRRYFAKYPADVAKVVINIKGGRDFDAPGLQFKCSNEAVAAGIEHTLEQLGSSARIAQWGVARKDPNHDYEDETLATIDSYVKAGKIDGITTSEINQDTLRSAAKKFRITAVEMELSLFYPEAIKNGMLAACAELDIPVIAYSPLGHGILGGQIKSAKDISEGDPRRMWPTYQGANLEANLALLEKVEKLAEKKGCSPAQISINWLVALSQQPGMPTIIPIPGSTNPARIRENATLVDLTPQDMADLDETLKSFSMAGDRYPAANMHQLQL